MGVTNTHSSQSCSINNIYQLEGRVPVGKAIPFGLQHILAMFVSNLAPITIIGVAAEPVLLYTSYRDTKKGGTKCETLYETSNRCPSGRDCDCLHQRMQRCLLRQEDHTYIARPV